MNSFLEIIIFFYVLRHAELASKFKGDFFNTKHVQQLFDLAKPHVLEYRSAPTETQMLDLIKIAGKEDVIPEEIVHTIWQSEHKVNEYTDEWLHDNTTAYAEWQNLMVSIRRVLTYIKTIQSDVTFENSKEIVEKVKAMFNADTSFSMSTSDGHDFFDADNHIQQDLETYTTGYPFIDRCLGGGWSPKGLFVFMGSPKVGKSKWLGNLCAQSVLNGHNSAYITLEMAYQKVNQRLGSNLFNIPMNEYKDFVKNKPEEFKQKMIDFHVSHALNKIGSLIIEEFPTSTATVYDIEAFLLKKEQSLSTPDKPFKFKNIFIDYINIMRDYKNPNSENSYQKIKSICEDVRAMAQRNGWAVISATQTNRNAFDASDITMSSVSESSGLIATVDALFGIIQTAIMYTEGVYYIKAVATRDADLKGNKKKFNENKTYLRIIEDPTEDMIVEGDNIPTKYNASYKPVYDFQKQQEIAANEAKTLPNLNASELELSSQNLFA